ncbi:carbohydrate ABC transporter permease [Muricomes intestini]|uniref:Carbohydrate ABC transporter membrane protein 1 (CUT1 family) n=1 Tax=Muricomes intestini TaxID=1796634 RepID=A0A4R3K2C8_9FIRM|nr:sugar ABC transporter permease [Muricomes intestini]TCS76420.1 carbohydrate ABC transporter membrane protein 1 (CUT1 family) [Muricomes intestini]HAX53212.1 sugar ABC transporter permease [Lachnospiraceae bacterium]HCR84873.1 sugar ABC transporter permease [Lachnospiraceae bacterium]
MKKSKLYPWYFAAGAIIIYTTLCVIPGIIGIGYAFTDWSAYSKEIHFVGWENFKKLFSADTNYMKYITNTLLFTAVTTVAKSGLGLLFALALSKNIKLKNFHRGVMYMPSVLSILIIGLVFTSILNPKVGILNQTLRTVGLDSMTQQWLTNPKIAFWSVMAVDIWRGTGYIMTMLIVGILAIPQVYYEAAGIDGASGWNKFIHITLPMLKQTLAVTIVLNVLYGMKVFDMVYALTNGGPGHTTEVMYTAVFKQFSQGLYAEGTTISSVMFIIMVVTGFFMIKVLTKDEVQE